MKCEKCNERDATFFYEENINGQKRAYHLCAHCAGEAGLFGSHTHPTGDEPFPTLFSTGCGDFLDDILGIAPTKATPTKACEGCGTLWREIAKSGKVGCPLCYSAFGKELEASIRAMHGNATHIGRAPAARAAAREKETRLAQLKQALRAAIDSENFEEAARLRDEIRALDEKKE